MYSKNAIQLAYCSWPTSIVEYPNAAMNEGCSVKCRFDFDFSSEFGYFSHSDFANSWNSSPGFGIFDSMFSGRYGFPTHYSTGFKVFNTSAVYVGPWYVVAVLCYQGVIKCYVVRGHQLIWYGYLSWVLWISTSPARSQVSQDPWILLSLKAVQLVVTL